uniref:Cation efflux protein transmembrane domain-containing protein n=1 Tax=Sarcophilus harrisii TaxID=9305 RepID=A0A7N4NGQ6_SARHA
MGRYSGKTCRLIFMLVLTTGFFVAELVSGYLGNSIALISDSFNMLSDLISFCARATHGYRRAEVVGTLSNAVFLTALCFTIFVEAILRLARPERIDDPELVLIVGALGLAVNVVGLLIFQDCSSWFTCGRRRRRLNGSKRGPSAPPEAVSAQQQQLSVPTAGVPGSDSALTLRVASNPRKAEKRVTLQPREAGFYFPFFCLCLYSSLSHILKI